MMDRRQFVNFLALIAAGAAARPEQIAAFEHYYHMNTPLTGGPFIAVDEIMLSGLATQSTLIKFDVKKQNEVILKLGLNAYGGIMRWVATPDQKIITDKFSWEIEPINEPIQQVLTGHISYVTQDGVRHYRPVESLRMAIRAKEAA